MAGDSFLIKHSLVGAFEFIATMAQIADIRIFMRMLPAVLSS